LLLNTRDAISLLRAYVAIQDQRQRTALVNLARHDREEPLQEDGTVGFQGYPLWILPPGDTERLASDAEWSGLSRFLEKNRERRPVRR
jgi:hypothetical protein